jgi:Rad3-related DNA helicase
MGVVRNYGSMLVELCSSIPDGIVAFFTSYSYMESIISEWDAMGILRQMTKHKLVFIETKDVVETTLALDNYRRACDSGRGAVFLSVARGKVMMSWAFFPYLNESFQLTFPCLTLTFRYQRELTSIGITVEQ